MEQKRKRDVVKENEISIPIPTSSSKYEAQKIRVGVSITFFRFSMATELIG